MSARRVRVRIGPEAQGDIRGIWLYSLRHWGETRATAYEAEIDRALATISDHPTLGFARPDLLPELRSFLVGEHVVFYRLVGPTLEVVRVLHKRQSSATTFDDEAETP